jgi:hypothetical protein
MSPSGAASRFEAFERTLNLASVFCQLAATEEPEDAEERAKFMPDFTWTFYGRNRWPQQRIIVGLTEGLMRLWWNCNDYNCVWRKDAPPVAALLVAPARQGSSSCFGRQHR